MYTRSLLRLFLPLAILTCLPLAMSAEPPPAATPKPSVVYKIQSPSQRLEMTVHTSRILTMDQKIPQAQVNNPDILEVTPLSPNQIQVSAKATGVTQINVWGEDQKLFTIDVLVFGDVRELEMLLRATFPGDALKVTPVSSSVMISGFVEQSEHIERIIRIAEEYYPKVINNMTVGGVQKVLLHIKVMEVSRTKLRRLSFDWAKITGSNMIMSGASGMLMPPTSPNLPSGGGVSTPAAATASNNPINGTMAFNIAQGNNAFFGVLNALRRNNLLKLTAEPTLIAESGRTASFTAGGQIAVPEPQGLGSVGVNYKDYGTKIDFVPIVLGNGKIHLEVRPDISELDYANSTTISGTIVPGFTSRRVDTAVELVAGQTIAIAGLLQTRLEAEDGGLPWISDVPYLGAAFRNVHESINEIELLILVTPELVEAMDPNEVPPCGPGSQTTSPSDWELYLKGYIEVPKCCPVGENCRGECQNNGTGSDGQPPNGMIMGPDEKIPAPLPSEGAQSSKPHSRYRPPKANSPTTASRTASPNGPSGMIGPVGYDVVK